MSLICKASVVQNQLECTHVDLQASPQSKKCMRERERERERDGSKCSGPIVERADGASVNSHTLRT